jgi:hypothetical protein
LAEKTPDAAKLDKINALSRSLVTRTELLAKLEEAVAVTTPPPVSSESSLGEVKAYLHAKGVPHFEWGHLHMNPGDGSEPLLTYARRTFPLDFGLKCINSRTEGTKDAFYSVQQHRAGREVKTSTLIAGALAIGLIAGGEEVFEINTLREGQQVDLRIGRNRVPAVVTKIHSSYVFEAEYTHELKSVKGVFNRNDVY